MNEFSSVDGEYCRGIFTQNVLASTNLAGGECFHSHGHPVETAVIMSDCQWYATLQPRVPSPPQANMQTVFQLCLTVIPMMFSLSMFNVITDSMLTKSVPSSDSGEAALPLSSQSESHQKTQNRSLNLGPRAQARCWDSVLPSSRCCGQSDRLSEASCT